MAGVRLTSMTPEVSSNTNSPKPRDCPTCGKPFVYSAPHLSRDWAGILEIVDVYLCFAHGFYTFRLSEGLKRRTLKKGLC
jgi:hypothetical protein